RSAVLPAGPLGQLRADVHGEGVAQVVLAIGRGDVALVAERDPSGPGFVPEQPVARGSRGAAGDAGPVAGRRAIAATTPQQQQGQEEQRNRRGTALRQPGGDAAPALPLSAVRPLARCPCLFPGGGDVGGVAPAEFLPAADQAGPQPAGPQQQEGARRRCDTPCARPTLFRAAGVGRGTLFLVVHVSASAGRATCPWPLPWRSASPRPG